MVIHDIQYRAYRLPFVNPFSTAHGTLTVREGAIVMVTTTRGETGLGEIAPFPGMSRETLAEAIAALDTLSPQLRGVTPEAALRVLDDERETLPASMVCGLEMALLCLVGPRFIADPSPSAINRGPTVRVNAVIGSREVQDAVRAAMQARRDGFSCVKLKVGVCGDAKHEVARIEAVLEALGSDVALRLDANEGWTYAQALDVLSRCTAYNIEYVEQPVHGIEDMRRLRREVPMALAADEAVSGVESARLVLQRAAADVLILKPQLTGGLRACQRIVEEATARGVACVFTTTIESGVSLAATLKLVAALPEITLACGFGTLTLLADDLIQEHLPVKDGMMEVPPGPAWGVTLDREMLRRYGRER